MKRYTFWIALLLFALPMPSHAKDKVRIIYGETKSVSLEKHKKTLERGRPFESFANQLDTLFKLKTTMTIAFEECGHKNAFYSATTKTITFCYELIDHLETRALKDYRKPREYAMAEAVAVGAFCFVLFHELGHALIDQFHLSFTGREEDVADQVAAFAYLNADPEMGKKIVTGVLWLFETSDSVLSEEAYADEHSLDKQRFYNMMCWAYGKDRNQFGYLESSLKGGRIRRCEDEFRKMTEGIRVLLTPHVDLAAWQGATNGVNANLPQAAPDFPHFNLQVGQIYVHPKYPNLLISFDGQQLMVAQPPPLPSPGIWPLLYLPERQWIPLLDAYQQQIPVVVMRIGSSLVVQWLP